MFVTAITLSVAIPYNATKKPSCVVETTPVFPAMPMATKKSPSILAFMTEVLPVMSLILTAVTLHNCYDKWLYKISIGFNVY